MAAVAPLSAVRLLTKAPPRCTRAETLVTLKPQFDKCLLGNCRICGEEKP